MGRPHVLLLAAAIAIVLVAGSRPSLVGDGGEYMAQAINFASGNGPALPARDVGDIQRRVGEIDPRHADWPIQRALTRSPRGGSDFVHFWFYALLAAPVLRLIDLAGGPPLAAFAIVNLTLLGVALWIALPRLGAALCLLLFAGPVVWYIDKPHTEAFTFALLAIAASTMIDRPWWAMVAAGAAATQNPPIAIVVPVVAAASAVRQRAILRDRRFVAGAAAGLALALLHPAYTYWRHGTASLLLGATRPGTPAAAEVLAIVFDPTLGLAGNFPTFLIVVACAVLVIIRRRPRALASPDVVAAAVVVVMFLYACARTTNLHHGGTPSFSRYSIWLIPLAIPLLTIVQMHGRRLWRAFSVTMAAASAVACLIAFHPRVGENAREPTWLATALWTHRPQWNNPVPEVFLEVVGRAERFAAPVALGGCEKVLLGGRGPDSGMWPVPCYPQEVPTLCRVQGTLCYANLVDGRYGFVRPPGRRRSGAMANHQWVWPLDTEPVVRRLYDGWGWKRLGIQPDGLDVLAAVDGVRIRTLGHDQEFVLVIKRTADQAALRFQPDAPMWGVFLDPRSGRAVETVSFGGASDYPWDVNVPRGFDLLLFTARLDPP